MSRKLRRWETAAFFLTCALGTLLHFTYGWSGENPIVGVFSAVNESTWEHMKLLFFPMLLLFVPELLLLSGRYRNLPAAKLLSILVGLALIPLLFYTYSGILGFTVTAVDISIFFLAAAAAHLVSFRLLDRGRLTGLLWQMAALLLLALLAFLFVWWTWHPPHIALFQDPVTGAFGIGG